MAYGKQSWQNTPATTTSISAERLLHIEDGIEAASTTADNAAATLASLTVEYFQDLVANMVRAGTNVAVVYDDAGGLLTISASGGGGGGSVTIAGITDATTIGKAVLAATSQANALSTLGAQAAGDYVLTAGLNAAVDNRIATSKGAPNGLGSLGSDGKLLSTQLPELAITRPTPVASQAEMLALDAQVGDVAIRTDVSENYILRFEPASQIGNWLKFSGAAGAVTSIAGKTGSVTLVISDISNSGTTGRALLAASTAADARAALDTVAATNMTIEWHTTTGGVLYGTPDPNGLYAPHPITNARLRYTNPLKEPTWDGNRITGGGGADATRYPYDIWEGP